MLFGFNVYFFHTANAATIEEAWASCNTYSQQPSLQYTHTSNPVFTCAPRPQGGNFVAYTNGSLSLSLFSYSSGCPSPQTFNYSTGSCTCPTGQYKNTVTGACEPEPNCEVPDVLTLLPTLGSKICLPHCTYAIHSVGGYYEQFYCLPFGETSCNADGVFSQPEPCIDCTGKWQNPTTGQCEDIPDCSLIPGSVYHADTNTCELPQCPSGQSRDTPTGPCQINSCPAGETLITAANGIRTCVLTGCPVGKHMGLVNGKRTCVNDAPDNPNPPSDTGSDTGDTGGNTGGGNTSGGGTTGGDDPGNTGGGDSQHGNSGGSDGTDCNTTNTCGNGVFQPKEPGTLDEGVADGYDLGAGFFVVVKIVMLYLAVKQVSAIHLNGSPE